MRKNVTTLLPLCLLFFCILTVGYGNNGFFKEEQPDVSEEIISEEIASEETQDVVNEEPIEEIQRRMREKSGLTDASVEKPVITPKVLVSFAGYKPDAQKTVYFEGENPAEDFCVIDAKTGEEVFTGKIQECHYDEQTDTYVRKGDFTPVQEEGTYYIETKLLGQSYYFEIGEEIYKKTFEELFSEIRAWNWQTEQMDVKIAAETLSELLLCHEIYGKDTELLAVASDKIKILLSAQAEDGSVCETLNADAGGTVSVEAGNLFAAVMAQASKCYREYDIQLSEQCLKAAGKAYDYSKKQKSGTASGAYAAAQLFKTTQNSKYHADLKQYFTDTDEMAVVSDSVDLHTMVTYLMTEGNVEQEICEMFMEDILNRAETLAKESETDYYLVSDADDEAVERRLEDMKVLALADYVIVSHEYYSILKEQLSAFHAKTTGEDTDVSFSHKAALLFILSDILEREEAIS